jgi:hypothetical protein
MRLDFSTANVEYIVTSLNPSITKIEAARRQLETAISLYFDNGDSLAIHSLAYASFKVLLDICPSFDRPDVAQEINQTIASLGWKNFNATPNFLKHADRDPLETLDRHTIDNVEPTIGFACCIYRRLEGRLTGPMFRFHLWMQNLYSDEFQVPPNSDPMDDALERQATEQIKNLPLEERQRIGKILTEAVLTATRQ